MDDNRPNEDMEISFAAELFAQLSEAAQREIIDLIKYLLSER